MNRAGWFLVWAFSIGLMGGCRSLNGARVVDAGFEPKVLMEYEVNGTIPVGTRIALIEDQGEVAVLESQPGEEALVIQNAKSDTHGDHFMGWYDAGLAIHYLVPSDRGKTAYRWEYPSQRYQLKAGGSSGDDELALPTPTLDIEAGVQLIPRSDSGQ